VMGSDGKLDVLWNRAHFGAWCIVSSPLILSLDLDSPNLAAILPFVGNEDAIAINQQWAGSAGFLVNTTHAPPQASLHGPRWGTPQTHASLANGAPAALLGPTPSPHTPPDSLGFVRYVGQLNARDDGGSPLRVANASVAEAEAWCNETARCACFTRRSGAYVNGSVGDVQLTRFEGGEAGRLLCSSNGIHVRDHDTQWATWVRAELAPADAEHGAQQVWAKPQPHGAWAFFLVNSDSARPMVSPYIDLAKLPTFSPTDAGTARGSGSVAGGSGGAAFTVRDVWQRAVAPALAPVGGIFRPPSVAPRDSAFYLVSPDTRSRE